MRRKIPKGCKRKLAQKKAARPTDEFVVVGTYKEKQLAWIKKNGVYNYPVREGDDFNDAALRAVKELWLYADAKGTRHAFAVKGYVGKITKAEFVAKYPSYAKLPSPRPAAKASSSKSKISVLTKSENRAYYVFEVTKLDYKPTVNTEIFIARTADFGGRSAKVKKAIAQFKQDGEFAPLAAYLPEDLSQVPPRQLRVCEPLVQLSLWRGHERQEESKARATDDEKADIVIEYGDSLELCQRWQPPTVIISDGPYGLNSYPGDPATPEGLADFYRPFLKRWHELSLPSTTLWFWNSEQGWANCHREIEECGWEFRNCHIWNKGMSHVAGNCNTKTIRKYPVVTEVCAQYVRKNSLASHGTLYPLRKWMREEWRRTGLPFRLTNVACGVKDAATRKYFSADHLWYFPPSEAFIRIASYANRFGASSGRPYFAKEDGSLFSAHEWSLMRAKFYCEVGISNVWNLPPVRGPERIKEGGSCAHMNQKPLDLLERTIRSSSDCGDVVWEPFGGLCSAAIAAYRTGRRAFSAEINPTYYKLAKERLRHENKDSQSV